MRDYIKDFDLDIEQYAFPELKSGDQDWRWCHKYCYDILKGNIPSCKKMQWAAVRHFRDLKRDDIYFDETAARSIVLWFKFCPIVKGKKSGQPTTLDPSQIFMAVSLIAWKWSDDKFEYIPDLNENVQVRHKGCRRFNQIYAQVSRKYGKTTFIAGVLLYLMYKYGYGPRVFSLATKRDQAKEVWNVAKKMIKLSPKLRQYFVGWANSITMPSTEGEFKPLASDSNSLDGLDPIAACLDECHAIKDRNLYGVLISAFGSNEGGEFLFAVITTAGFILQGLCVDLYKNGERVLDPDDPTEQDNYFYAIFELDKGDDWSDEKNWYKSNPGLVYGRPSLSYIRDRYREATMSRAEKVNFLTKHCNMFVNSSDKWLNPDLVKLGERDLNVEDYFDRPCYVGFDRSHVNDITSASVLFPTNAGGIDIFLFNLQSRGAVESAPKVLHDIYMKAEEVGDLRIVPGAHIRDAMVKDFIREIGATFRNVVGYYYDPYHMKEVALDLEEEGYNMISVSMGPGNVSEPSKKLEMLFNDELVHYQVSPLFEYACENVMYEATKYDNGRPYRDPSQVNIEKIDPVISTILALSGATLIKVEDNVYESHGLLTL